MKRLVCVLMLGMLASGCSIKMGYNNMDRLIRWGVSDYVDLNAAQKEVLIKELDVIHNWHRRNHLPLYASYIERLATDLPDGVSVNQVADLFEQFEMWIGEVETQFNPLIIDIMVSLTDEQVAELPEKLAEDNDEFADPEADKPLREIQLEWAEDFGDGLKNFTGRLSKAQRDYLERRSLEYQPERALWAAYRQRFQNALLDLLPGRANRATFVPAYEALVASRESYYGAELDRVFANNQRLNQEVTAHILSNLSDKQTVRFVEALTELSEDFAELSTQA